MATKKVVEDNKILDVLRRFGRRESVYFSPEMCTWMLEYSVSIKNRNISIPRAEEFTRAMENGEWKLTGQGLIFNQEGKVMDGFTRLYAGSKSTKGFETYVTYGISMDAMPFIDGVTPRGPKDCFKMLGAKYCNDLPPLMIFILSWEAGNIADQLSRTGRRTHWSNIEMINDYLKYEASVNKSLKITLRANSLIRSGVLSFLGWWTIMFMSNGEYLWNKFIDGFATGANLTITSPILGLRKLVEDNKRNKARKYLPVEMSRAIIFTVEKFLRDYPAKSFVRELNKFRNSNLGFTDFYKRLNSSSSTAHLEKVKDKQKVLTYSVETWNNLVGRSVPEVVRAGQLFL
jgi:hypothetical protein